MVKADGHVRIRHESKENGQIRIRHESKEKGAGISYIEVDSRDKDNLIPFYDLESLPQFPDQKCLSDGNHSPISENSCSSQSGSPQYGSVCSNEISDSSKSSSRNSKNSDCDNCSEPLLNRESSPARSVGGACNVTPDDSIPTGDDSKTALCSCDNCTDDVDGSIPSQQSNRKDPWFKRGFHYDLVLQSPGPTDESKNGHLAPAKISCIQCPDNGSYKNLKSDLFVCSDELSKQQENRTRTTRKQKAYHVFVLLLLLLANLLNYMDRYTIAGVLPQIKEFYGDEDSTLSDSDAGLLQTSFIVFYMIFSPLFGYLGDRYNRTILMSIGILAWSVVTLAGSFIPSHLFWLFVFMRGMVGIGEASYSTIAPTIIADLFTKDQRTKALAFFYFAIPVGSGLGYIVGSMVAKYAGAWQWSLRFTPGLGLLCSILIFFFVKEPPRGESDGHAHHQEDDKSGFLQDLLYLVKNKSFMLSTGGFTCVAFLAGALSFWAPTFMEYGIEALYPDQSTSNVGLLFGIITCVAGLLGVLIGSETARRLRHRYKRADPMVCAFGLICSAPFFFLALFLSTINTTATWVMIFIGEVLLCLNWSIVTDILLYVVIPTRRSTAEAFQILLSHALGDAGSPYLVGLMSDLIKGDKTTVFANFVSLQYSLYSMSFVAVVGGAFFLGTAHYLVKDKARADKYIKGETSEESPVDSEESSCDAPHSKDITAAVMA